jgi:hypothetical protein
MPRHEQLEEVKVTSEQRRIWENRVDFFRVAAKAPL